MTTPDDDLRRLLNEAVVDIEPSPALPTLKSRTKATTMNRTRPWIFAAAGAVAATAATVTVVALTSNNAPGTDGDGPAASSPTSTATATGSPTGSAEPSTPATESRALPAYFTGDTPTGPRLFREFVRAEVPTGTPAIAEAVTLSLAGAAKDPDYYSPWADLGASAGAASYEGGTLTVDISGSDALRDRPDQMSKRLASVAVQQVLYTAQAELGEGNDVPVQLLLNGGRTDTILGVPTAEPLAVDDPMSVQSTVWVSNITEGDEVTSPFTVEGRGAFFEAHVAWQLLQGGEVVASGAGMAQECCMLSPYSLTITADPGDYLLRVYDEDMSGGEGPGEAEDTKNITVR